MDTRLIGVVAPLGALRGSEPRAVGEFPDLAEFALFCRDAGIGLIQLLPVNDTGYESSPYFSLTSFALHPLYLRIADLTEAKGFLEAARAIDEEFHARARFPYHKILRAKMGLLREIYAASEAEIAARAEKGGSLAAWIDANSWVRHYAVYRALKEANGEKSWKEWPALRRPAPGEIDAIWDDLSARKEHLFWAWLQMALDAQFSAAARAVAEAGIVLKGDLPILMNDDSCDVWGRPEIFAQELSAGAPPDMYSPEGQNWGFPLYDWEAQEKDGFAWWKARLKAAEKYYRAYRIDHVLGFFRIWASSRDEVSSALGRCVPAADISAADLKKLGFDEARVRWLSLPHVPTGALYEALRSAGVGDRDLDSVARAAFDKALDRIGSEELWLFKPGIKGEKDLLAAGLRDAAAAFLVKAWRDRTFVEHEKGRFSPTWQYRDSGAYKSLCADERLALDKLIAAREAKSEKIWEAQGTKLLSALAGSTDMLPCAEDLGAIPACVFKTLARLKILGLRVVRWHREWDKPGQPYVPFAKYPEASVCAPAVHDSSTVREWWEREADQAQFAAFLGFPSLPKTYNPGTAKAILTKVAGARSRIRVFQIQDLLHLSSKWYSEDPAAERVNVPGTNNDFNWTYRLPASIAELDADADLANAIRALGDTGARK